MTNRECAHPDCGFAASDVCARDGCPGDETAPAPTMITAPNLAWDEYSDAIDYFMRLVDGVPTADTIEVDGSQLSALLDMLNEMALATIRYRTNQSIAEGAIVNGAPERDPEIPLVAHLNAVLIAALSATQPVIPMRVTTLTEVVAAMSQGKALHDAVGRLMASETDAEHHAAMGGLHTAWRDLHS